MLKNEQSRDFNQQMRTLLATNTAPPLPSIPQPPPLSSTMHPTASGVANQRFINAKAIDITSIKGQFAWEKIPHSDIYMPIIFRENTHYFCVRMLRKLLPDYPEDVINHSVKYQYPSRIPSYNLTNNEVDLINRINSHHSRWSYSRQPFTLNDKVVRVSDYLPFYEHLRFGRRTVSTHPNTTTSTAAAATNASRQPLPQTHQSLQRSNEYMNNMPTILRGQPALPPQGAASVMLNSHPSSTDFSREPAPSIVRPLVSATANLPRPSRPQQQRPVLNPFVPTVPQRPMQQVQSTPSSTNVASNITSTVSSKSLPPPPPPPIVSNATVVSQPTLANSSSTLSPITPLLKTPSPCSSSSSSPIISSALSSSTAMQKKPLPKPSRPLCGWIQVNKLYTPYITSSANNHHLYKLPVSLLSFYHLLKTSSNDSTDSKETIFPFEQTLATAEEIELINKLCTQQNIQPFTSDTKLVDLVTFYQHCSANIIFAKELSPSEPKASICKDWASVVKINGGICRLRNIASLNEQTVPIIGNNLLKSFVLSPQTLSSARLTEPTANEVEFLEMILFFSNMSINLRHAQLIDIESVQKEYNVDLILLFNDKFPLNVLNYQQQDNRANPPQTSILPSTTTSTTNSIAESTPPPSPPSPPAVTHPPPQLPFQPSANRYNKVVSFHGHSLTAYICSGLDANSQRDCVSIKSLCEILFPNTPITDKIEGKMLKILRSKNINRFRPQNQQSVGFTRLIDITDAEKHWEDIEKEMHATLRDDHAEENIRLSTATESSMASTVVESVETNVPPVENKGEKRALDGQLDEEDVPVLERLNKRMRVVEKENDGLTRASAERSKSESTTAKSAGEKNGKRRLVPSHRTNRNSAATWVKKYQIEDCFVRINQYDPVYDDGTT